MDAVIAEMPVIFRVTTHLENLEKSGNWKVVRKKSGKLEKVRESYYHHLAGARVAKILPHFKDISIDEMSPAVLEMSGKSRGI